MKMKRDILECIMIKKKDSKHERETIMKKRLLAFFCIVVIMTIMGTTVYADIGPKPSIVIDFKGLENENYYVTLLSEKPSTGPHSALGKHSDIPRYNKEDAEYNIWEKFQAYEDNDGYYFLQYFRDCTDTSKFTWGYYPPSKFKILLYFPEQDGYLVSNEIHEVYAFHSYYAVDATDLKIQANSYNSGIKVEQNYNYTWEIISLLARIIATITIEILIALLFGFRKRKQLLIIGTANIFTQSILNILLSVINYNLGGMAFIINYIWMELVVFGIEAFIYSMYLNKYSDKKLSKKFIVLYALVANILSFVLGLYIARLIPGIM